MGPRHGWHGAAAGRELGHRLAPQARVDRLRGAGWQIGQCAVGAALAWLVATEVLGHNRPFFAPVAAVVALGVSYGQRFRRIIEVVVGVAIGVGVGDLFVHVAGSGVWQIALVVALAMTLAVLLDAGTLLVTQAGVQAVIVTTLLPGPDAGLGRWLDAVVGGAVALLVAAVAPARPVHRPRELTAGALAELGDLLHQAERSARQRDLEQATRTLERARQTEARLVALRTASIEGLDVVRVSPLYRRQRGEVRMLAELMTPLDRAVRNVRVLVRRLLAAVRQEESLPEPLLDLVADLADATTTLAEQLAVGAEGDVAVGRLEDVAEASADVPLSTLSADVVLGQVRSAVVDLLQVAGLEPGDARSRVPPVRPRRWRDGERT